MDALTKELIRTMRVQRVIEEYLVKVLPDEEKIKFMVDVIKVGEMELED